MPRRKQRMKFVFTEDDGLYLVPTTWKNPNSKRPKASTLPPGAYKAPAKLKAGATDYQI